MSIEEMREEFEAAYVAWLVSTGWDKESALLTLEISKNGDYFSTSAQGAWWAWQASRAALVVELPESYPRHRDSVFDVMDAELVVEAIEDAGVKVKP